MADITIIGFAPSTYVRTVRMACEEKGVSYELEPLDFGSDALRAVHPFSKIPAMRHDGLTLWETTAICRYVDEAFDGPALVPAGLQERAWMEQWLSAGNAYYDRDIVRALVLERLVAPRFEREPDEAKIAEAMPRITHQIQVMDAWLADHKYLAGGTPSIADYLLVPMLFYAYLTPEGKPVIDDAPAMMRWWADISARPSFAATAPPMG